MKMQRQSLGHGGVTAVNSPLTDATEQSQDAKRLSITANSSSSSPLASKQKQKSPEKIIHGIPILTFVCFLILYLSSHDPTQLELDAFGGLKRPEATLIDTWRVSGEGGGEAETVANRRRRDLREAAGKIRGHRKLGDF